MPSCTKLHAMTNWMATTHRGSLNLKFVELLHKIGQRIPINLGEIIFNQIMSFIEPKEPKVKMSYPSLIFGILTSQGLRPYDFELLESPPTSTVHKRLCHPPHVVDVLPTMVPQPAAE